MFYQLYRSYIFYDGYILAVILPTLLYLASISTLKTLMHSELLTSRRVLVMAIMSVVESALPGDTFFQGAAVSFGVPWISLSAAYNLLVTSLICSKILRMRYQLRGVMEPEVKDMYTGVVAILIESALPLSAVGIVFAVLLGVGQPYAVLISGIWAAFVVCALSRYRESGVGDLRGFFRECRSSRHS